MERCLAVHEQITPQNRDERLNALLGSDWLSKYLDGETDYNELDEQQRLFADAYDGVVAGMLDGGFPDATGGLLQGRNIRNALYDDGFVDAAELDAMLSSLDIYDGAGQRRSLSGMMNDMTEQEQSAFRSVAGGVISGLVDEDANGRRYNVSEADGLVSSRALRQININNQSTTAFLNGGGLRGAMEIMQQICDDIVTDNIEYCEPEALPMASVPLSIASHVKSVG